jgi:hypothetical protein
MDEGDVGSGEPGQLGPHVRGMRGDRLAVDGDQDLLERQSGLLCSRAASGARPPGAVNAAVRELTVEAS